MTDINGNALRRDLLNKVMDLVRSNYSLKRWGPFAVEVGSGWISHLQETYHESPDVPQVSVHTRLLEINGVVAVGVSQLLDPLEISVK